LILGVVAMTFASGKSLRTWMREESWIGFAWVGIFMIPTAVLGNVKIGGSLSPFALTTWFLAAAGIGGLTQVAARSPQTRAQFAGIALAAFIALAIGFELVVEQRRATLEDAVFQIRHRGDNPQEQALEFARAHPGEVLFVSNPLIGLYSDATLYHSFKGILDRVVSGLAPPGPELLRAYNPPRLAYLATRRRRRNSAFERPDFLYPEFDTRIQPERMDHHTIWVRTRDAAKLRSRLAPPNH